VTEGKFELSDENTIKIIGTSFDLNSLESLNNILQKIIQHNNVKKINIIGNFNTKLKLDSVFSKISKIDESLSLLHGITQTIEQSNIIFISHVKGIMKGLALELALSCNFIKAEVGTSLDFSYTNEGQIPFFGTIQRLIKVLGYKKALKIFLTNGKLNFEEANNLNVINNETVNTIDKKKPFWDQDFTNTFIYFNSKIHSTYKNKKPAYNALLSIIFESSVCEYNVGMSIEKRWAKWLLLNSLVKN
tara:strand:- start:65 stop:802 length:738 start_codon:yes stop_codon:yes gene_type:complete